MRLDLGPHASCVLVHSVTAYVEVSSLEPARRMRAVPGFFLTGPEVGLSIWPPIGGFQNLKPGIQARHLARTPTNLISGRAVITSKATAGDYCLLLINAKGPTTFQKEESLPMADEKKTLEMRVAELEDKLAQVHITEDEMATYNKVAAKLGTAQPCQPATQQACVQSPCVAAQQPCVAAQQPNLPIVAQPQPCQIYHCIMQCIIYRCIRNPIINNPITWNECQGPCLPGNCATGGIGGGGFGGLGG
jgi:hypothetical protein